MKTSTAPRKPTVAEQIAAIDARIEAIRAESAAIKRTTGELRAYRLRLEAFTDQVAARNAERRGVA